MDEDELRTGPSWNDVAVAFDRIEPLPEAERAREVAKLAPALAAKVRAMLASAGSIGLLDDAVAAEVDTGPAGLGVGERIGPFAIQRLIGRGGMGEVYLANRADVPFEQRVALKLLRVDAVSNTALFARERRVLARLDHPGIARLIDGGVTTGGRPWMAMVYVEGQPIDRWVEQNAASLNERLRLFREICAAVAYAHANLVVHRDLKPGNILVDANGRGQLLDFGIAKLVEEDVENTLAPGATMTPEYAAPEQLENAPLTVATDIHALGLILYRLLTGTTPWWSDGGTFPILVRRVLSEAPQPPSRLAGRVAGSIAATRLRGDLDAIVLKALRKVPTERYASVRELADDVERFQTERPVRARAGSRRYRLRKYLWRNRWGVGAAAAVVLALLIGAGGIALQSRRTAIERDNALAEARRSDSIVQTLTLIFSQGGYSSDLTLKQTLDDSALRLLATLDGSERSGVAVAALSDLYVNMQDAKGSHDLLTRALAQKIGGDSASATARLKANLADAALSVGANDNIDQLLNEARSVFATDPDRYGVELQQIISTRAAMARRKRDYDTAITLLRESLPTAERVLADKGAALLTLYNNLLVYLIESNRLDEVGPAFARIDPVLARPRMRDTIQALGIDQLRGAWRLRSGNAAAAEKIATDVVARRRRLFGETPGLSADLTLLAKAQIALGKFAEARVALVAARPLAERFLGVNSLPVMIADLTLAQVQAELGDTAAARTLIEAVRVPYSAMPSPNPLTPQLHLSEALLALREGHKTAASEAADAARAVFATSGPAGASGIKSVEQIEARIAALP